MKISKKRRAFSIILFIILLPFIVLFFSIRAIVKYAKWKNFVNSDKKGRALILDSDITKVDIMEGYVFEELLRGIFFYIGFDAKITLKSNDFGADLLLTSPEGSLIVVQAKRYKKTVGARSVQEIFSAKEYYKANEAWVITSSHFSSQAESLARELDVRLIDREEFVELLLQAKAVLLTGQKEKASAIDTETTSGFDPNQSDFSI